MSQWIHHPFVGSRALWGPAPCKMHIFLRTLPAQFSSSQVVVFLRTKFCKDLKFVAGQIFCASHASLQAEMGWVVGMTLPQLHQTSPPSFFFFLMVWKRPALDFEKAAALFISVVYVVNIIWCGGFKPVVIFSYNIGIMIQIAKKRPFVSFQEPFEEATRLACWPEILGNSDKHVTHQTSPHVPWSKVGSF